MEANDEETVETERTFDLSKQSLKRIERPQGNDQLVTTLILDYNEIQKLDNLEGFPNLKKLSVIGNQLIRMYYVSALPHLVMLDLSQNALVTIEGLKDMANLKVLKLAKNKLKTIEHLSHNYNLEVLDVSENFIVRISDISHLVNLKELYLHENKIGNLSHSEKKLPNSIKILTLNNNCLIDLNEVSHLSSLTSLTELSLANNPCVNFSENQKFNYRPFVKNWCSSLVVLDFCLLDDIECLKAEWLYSQGRGRSFKIGEHAALVEYLSSVCPGEKEENAETEDVKKLKLILSKAQLHQQQLREQMTSGENFKSTSKKKVQGVPERMVSSFQDCPARDQKSFSDLMAQSLDSGILKKTLRGSKTDCSQTPLQTSTSFVPIPDTLISPDVGQPIALNAVSKTPPFSSRTSRSSSRNSPLSTPENKRKTCNTRNQYESSSPVGTRISEKLNNHSGALDMGVTKNLLSRSCMPLERKGFKARFSYKNYKETSEEEDAEAVRFKAVQLRMNHRKSRLINSKRAEHGEEKDRREKSLSHLEGNTVNMDMWKAAVCIQRRWRGYKARNLNPEVLSGCKNIQIDRIQEYLMKVLSDMETTRIAMESNKKLVSLQMQAINALWKKMTGLAIDSQSEVNKSSIQDLVKTCSILNKQVEALQVMVKNLQTSSKSGSTVPMATQTEIIAVHTPLDETRVIFPYSQNLKYVTSDGLSIDSVESEEKEFLDHPVDSAPVTITELYPFKDVSESSKFTAKTESFEEEVQVENLTKPTVTLNMENEVTPTPNELDKSNTNE